MPKKSGRPRDATYKDDNGHTWNGLGRRPDARFYVIDDRNVTFGKDPAVAIFRYKQYLAKQRGENFVFDRDVESQDGLGPILLGLDAFFKGEAQEVEWARWVNEDGEEATSAKLKWFVPVDVVWQKLREFILSDPKQAALKLGIPEVANLSAVKPPPPSLPLKHVAEFYRAKIDLTATEANRSVRWWDHFRKIVKCQTVREIEADHIQLYHDAIIAEYRKDKRSPAWVKHRFGKVKTMLANAMTKGQDQQEISRVLGLCKMLVAPRNRNGVDSDPIIPKDLRALLKHADKRETAIILIGLNCAFYPVDISRLPISAVDLGKRTVIFDRTKTGNPIPRVAILWARTVKAIKEYQAAYPHEATDKDGQPLLFANSEGRQLLKDTITKWIKNLCAKAECKVVFSQLRDGAYTAVVDAGVDITQAEILLGHSVGKVKDAYLKRRPSIVSDACEAVERHYFRGKNRSN